MSGDTPASSLPPLVVDLDGTLIATDLLHETATRFLVARPAGILRLLAWAASGRANLKAQLAEATELDVSVLPYRPEVLAWLEAEAAAGRRIILASASHDSLVQAVASHVGLFEAALGTTADNNLRSSAKAAELEARFGDSGFEYVGNHQHDLKVWKAASAAHVVSRSASLARSASSQTTLGRTFTPPTGRVRALVKSMRPHQWVKNLLVLVPLFTAQIFTDPDAIRHALLAFTAFCLVASSVYVLNDLADLDNDRHHPEKRNRPFAAGSASLLHGWLLWPLLAVAGFAIAVAFEPWMFTAVLTGYFATTVLYTFWLKRVAVIDVVLLGALYTVRVVAGVAAISVLVSMWLLTFSLFLFLSLALVKRVSELTAARREGNSSRGRGYVNRDLELLASYGVSSSIAAALIFALYVDDPETQRLYQTPELLWAALPILLAWLMRTWIIAHRGLMHQDPIVFAIRDRKSLAAGVLVLAVFVAAKVVTL
ncbi:MAG: UbiA family prenyltransferase [Aeromicrobium sp.]